MNIVTEFYLTQNNRWPTEGQHILAHFDETSVVVYQAYRFGIGQFAAKNGYFGSDFSLNRMSWFKPNFLWMMYRSGWGTKENQEVTLAVRIQRSFFESVLEQAVASILSASFYENVEDWKRAVAISDVRLQWDPDHSPSGSSLKRRAIQLGLRREMLKEYSRDAIIEVEDISDFVEAQRINVYSLNQEDLVTPFEDVYTPSSAEVAAKLGLSQP